MKSIASVATMALVFSLLTPIFVIRVSADTTTTLFPNGQGTYTQWDGDEDDIDETGSVSCGSSDGSENIAEDSDNFRESVLISLSSIPNGATITSVAVEIWYRDDVSSGSNGTLKTFSRLNGTNIDAGTDIVASSSTCGSTSQTLNVADTVKSAGTTLEIGVVKTVSDDSSVWVGALRATVTYTVPDTTAPVVVISPDTQTLEATSGSGATANFTVSATDNIDGDISGSVTCDATSGNTFPLGTTVVECSVSDAAGNPASDTASITVEDTTAPIIVLNGSDTLALVVGDIYNELGAVATDVVDGDVTVFVSDNVNTSVPGAYEATYNAVDAAGNNAVQIVRSITVSDESAPEVTIAPNSQVVEATSAAGATATYTVSAIDNVDGDISGSATCDTASGSTFPLGITNIECSATDSSSNTGIDTASVTVEDTTAPVIVLNGSDTIALEVGDSYTDLGALATDLVDPVVIVVVNNPVNTAIPGVYQVIYDASDTAGNDAVQVVRSVTVSDVLAPVIAITPDSQTLEATGPDGAVTNFSVTVTDDVDGDISGSATCDATSGSTFPLGTTVVECSVSDAAGNPASDTASITVEDTTAPTIVLNGSDTLALVVGDIYNELGAVATDVVDGDVTVFVSDNVNTAVPGAYEATYNAVDAAGNNATQVVRSITVSDVNAPVITIVPDSQTLEATGPTGAVADLTVSANDDIDGDMTGLESCSHTSGDTFPIGTTVVECTASDSSSNQGFGSATITVVDTTAPLITLNGDVTVDLLVGDSFVDAGASATDTVDGEVTVVVGGDTVNTAVAGTYVVTYNASDVTGNTAFEVTRTVNVAEVPVEEVEETPAPTLEEVVAPTDNVGEETPVRRIPGQFTRSIGQVLGAFTTTNDTPASTEEIEALKAKIIALMEELLGLLQKELEEAQSNA